MENYKIENDIKVLCVQADTFPDGVMAAYDKLRTLLPPGDTRMFYGISNGSPDGKIIYKAAVEEKYEGEGAALGCEEFIIKKGNYFSSILKDYTKNMPEMTSLFQKLLEHPHLDPKGYCIEIYFNKTDVQCLVRLTD